MPFNAQDWVKGLKLPEAEQKIVLDAIGKGGADTLKVLENNQLGQEQVTNELKRISALEQDLQKKMREEDAFRTSLVSTDHNNQEKMNAAVAARKKAEDALQTARDRLKSVATEFEVPEEKVAEIFKDVAPAATTNNPPARSEEPHLEERFVTHEMFRVEARAYARLATLIPSLEREHFKLFGENAAAPDWEKLVEDTVASKGAKTLKQVYEEHYKVAERRQELQNADIEARIATARKEGADSERSKILADNPTLGQNIRRDVREGSPVLDLARRQQDDANKNNPPKREPSAVESAVIAFNEAKYRVTGGKAA